MFAQSTSQDNIIHQMRTSNVDSVKCYCSKKCKGLRGLKFHQWSCRVIIGLNGDIVSTNDTKTDEIAIDNLDNFIAENLLELKPGIKLPKTEAGWKEADMYFRSVLHAGDINISNPNTSVKNINVIYEYFAKNLGTIDKKQIEDELNEKYKDYGKQQLKQELRELKKKQNKDVASIRLISKLCNKIDSKNYKIFISDHDFEIRKHIWGYSKAQFDNDENLKPSFSKLTCYNYFKKVFKATSPQRIFTIPSWLTKFNQPTDTVDDTSPTYVKITNTIRKMKSNGSPCPLDQIPVIAFIRSAYLCSYLTKIIQVAWCNCTIPEAWKRAVTILIHKKNSTHDPANFCPITLQSILLKV